MLKSQNKKFFFCSKMQKKMALQLQRNCQHFETFFYWGGAHRAIYHCFVHQMKTIDCLIQKRISTLIIKQHSYHSESQI